MAQPTITNNTIVGKIKTRLEAIATGASYYYTLDDVFDNKPSLADVYANSTNTKVANIRDTFYEKIGEASEGSKQIHDMMMTVEIDLIYKGSDAAAVIRKMDADVQKAIAQDLEWDDLAFVSQMRGVLKKECGWARDLWCDHSRGYCPDRGYLVKPRKWGTGIHGRMNQAIAEKPYPAIDPLTCKPLI